MNETSGEFVEADGDGGGDCRDDEMYSLYTGLNVRRRLTFLSMFSLSGRKHCCRQRTGTAVSGSLLTRVAHVWLTNVVVSVFVIVAVLGVSIGLGLHAVLRVKPQPLIDFSLKSFTVPNHQVTRHQEAFDVAVEDSRRWNSKWLDNGYRSRRSSSKWIDRSRLSVEKTKLDRRKRDVRRRSYHRRKVIVVYVAVGGGDHNIFTRQRIETIHRIETEITRMSGYSEFCFKAYSHRSVDGQCDDALDSLVATYFYRSSTSNDDVKLVDNFDATVRAILSSPFGFLYTDGHANQSFFQSTFLKTEFSFAVPFTGI